MSIIENMKEIESHSFAARLNMASNFSGVLQIAQKEVCVQSLLQELKQSIALDQLLRRIEVLTRQRIDPRYENPWDTALTVYLWTTSLINPEKAKIAAYQVDQLPRCWWAREICSHLLRSSPVRTKSTFQFQMATFAGPQWPAVSGRTEASEEMVLASFLVANPAYIAAANNQIQIGHATEMKWRPCDLPNSEYHLNNDAPVRRAA